MIPDPAPRRIRVSQAREQLAAIVMRVQDPREYCILLRHGKPVAAVVSMASLERIHRDEDAETWTDPKRRPLGWMKGPDGRYSSSDREGAEFVREIQLARWQERRVLERVGMEVLAGGELTAEMAVPVEPEVEVVAKRGFWSGWRRGRA